VAIVGKPNAGKSTLLNTLLNENRAIVSEIPGTTRDTIEEVININGILFRLMDTAGIREHSQDVIENMGITKSREKIEQADLVLYLFDVNDIETEELTRILRDLRIQNPNIIPVANKADVTAKKSPGFSAGEILISAKAKTGIEELTNKLFTMAGGESINNENIIVTNARHYGALADVARTIAEIKSGIENHISGDLLSVDINRCLAFLGEITGEITNEDRLDYIFSKFCIGK
jgi:tRNA modification GTPase